MLLPKVDDHWRYVGNVYGAEKSGFLLFTLSSPDSFIGVMNDIVATLTNRN